MAQTLEFPDPTVGLELHSPLWLLLHVKCTTRPAPCWTVLLLAGSIAAPHPGVGQMQNNCIRQLRNTTALGASIWAESVSSWSWSWILALVKVDDKGWVCQDIISFFTLQVLAKIVRGGGYNTRNSLLPASLQWERRRRYPVLTAVKVTSQGPVLAHSSDSDLYSLKKTLQLPNPYYFLKYEKKTVLHVWKDPKSRHFTRSFEHRWLMVKPCVFRTRKH